VLRLEYPTVICTVFASYVTGLTHRNESIPDIVIRITNACYMHIPVLRRQPNNSHKTLISPAATYGT